MTLEEMRTRILEQLDDSTSAPVFWGTADIDLLIQDAREIVAEEVRAHRKTVYVPKRDGTMLYNLLALEPNAMTVYRLWDHDQHRRLQPVTMAQLDTERQRWLTVTGEGPHWWFPVSWGQFGVWPATSVGGGLWQVECWCWPETMEDEDVDLPEPEPDQDLCTMYGAYEGLLQQWEVTRAMPLLTEFVARWPDAQARADVRRLQSRHWGREAGHGDRRH